MDDVHLLPFDPGGGGSCPVQYEVCHAGHDYYVRYRHSWLSIECDDEEVFAAALAPEEANDGEWSDEETNVYLALISDAIRRGALSGLRLPNKREVRAHPLFCPGPLPRYSVLLCKDRSPDHRHATDCYSSFTLSAKELHEWREEHGDDFDGHPLARAAREVD